MKLVKYTHDNHLLKKRHLRTRDGRLLLCREQVELGSKTVIVAITQNYDVDHEHMGAQSVQVWRLDGKLNNDLDHRGSDLFIIENFEVN